MARVLLIEDNEDDREVYRAILHHHGFDVVIAEDGPSGLNQAFASQPDAILIDIMIPAMNGLLVCEHLSSNPATAHIPIICMSAHDVSQHTINHAGAKEFLPKPVDSATLVRTIRRYVGREDAEALQENGP